jgi:ribosomal protein S18 acetylase RimI-like enzyme
MGTASRILADGFFSDKNFLGYQLEKLRTYLSLESDFPRARDEHVMLVACQNTDGKVVACCDIDNRPYLKQRPYMCNLAVDTKWRGKGLAKALIAECEEIALQWGTNELHLKARQSNDAAVALYKSLGYEIQLESYDVSYRDYLVVMKKSITSDGRNGVLVPAGTDATTQRDENEWREVSETSE